MFVCRKYRTIFFSFFAFFSYLLRFMMTIVPPLSALWIMISWLDCKFLMVSFSCTVMFCWWLVYFLLPKLIIPFFTYEIYWLCFYWWNILIVFLLMKYIDCVFIDEIYWLCLSQWSCVGRNEWFSSCLVWTYPFFLVFYYIPCCYCCLFQCPQEKRVILGPG